MGGLATLRFDHLPVPFFFKIGSVELLRVWWEKTVRLKKGRSGIFSEGGDNGKSSSLGQYLSQFRRNWAWLNCCSYMSRLREVYRICSQSSFVWKTMEPFMAALSPTLVYSMKMLGSADTRQCSRSTRTSESSCSSESTLSHAKSNL